MGSASKAHMELDATRFVASIRDRLVGSLVLYCRDRDAAEDLAQEALARTWQRWHEVAKMEHPEAWVWRTAINLANSRGRRLMVERRANRRVGTRTLPTLPDSADQVALRDAVAALPKGQRSAIVCRYYAGFSVAQSAEAMGCKEDMVKALTSQGLEDLRLEDLRLDGLVNDPPEAGGVPDLSGAIGPIGASFGAAEIVGRARQRERSRAGLQAVGALIAVVAIFGGALLLAR